MVAKRTHYRCDPANPEPAGICDRGGEMRLLRELLYEQEWRGDRLVRNGFRVCRFHIDTPNPQGRTLRLKPDPQPVIDPRPDQRLRPVARFVSDGTPSSCATGDIPVNGDGLPIFIGDDMAGVLKRFPE